MKKNIIFCLCIAVVALFSACKDPEGMYNPSKKIQKIFYVNDEGVNELTEVWNWDGKLLTSIDNVDGSDTYKTVFTYDSKNRLATMDAEDGHGEFIYNGKYLEKIVLTSEGISYTMEIKHEKGKISEITMDNFMELLDWKTMKMVNPLRFMIPEAFPAVEKAMKKCPADAKGEQIVVKLIWKGDNVSSLVMDVPVYGMMFTETIDFTFDNYNNPMYGSFASMVSDAGTFTFLNKNNPLTMKTSYLGQVLDSSEFTYEYEGKYPIKVTSKSVEEDEVYTETYVYEY